MEGVPQGSIPRPLLFFIKINTLFAASYLLYFHITFSCWHTDNCDIADPLPGSSTVLHHHQVSATVLTLCFHQAERHGGQCVLEHSVFVGL